MRRTTAFFALATILSVIVASIVKSRYYYFPYPNLIEYGLSIMLLSIAALMVGTNRLSFRAGLLSGTAAVGVLMLVVNVLNAFLYWHPLRLNMPFSGSQSFEVDFEPYQWEKESPGKYGHSDEEISMYITKTHEWQRLRGLLVVRDDKLIVEEYFSGTTKYSAFNVHSVTKSITSALIGLAIKQGHLNSVDDLVLPFFPEYGDHQFGDFKKALTVKHLLTMRGGWSSGDGHQTAEQCILKEPLHTMPDNEFKYFTGSQNILSAVLTKATGQSTREFAEQHLFKPLGIRNAFWRETGGYYCGGDESYYTGRDLARFGWLYLNSGYVNGKPLLDSIWVQKTFTSYTVHNEAFRSFEAYNEVGYGLCWWIFHTEDNDVIFSARGKGGQHIMVIPDKNMVIVILQEWSPIKKRDGVEDRILAEWLKLLLRE